MAASLIAGFERQQEYACKVAARKDRTKKRAAVPIVPTVTEAERAVGGVDGGRQPELSHNKIKWSHLPEWRQHVNRAKFSLYFNTQARRA
jgi:hypothetical protein